MSRYSNYNRPWPRVKTIKAADEPVVRNGLAYTPADMARLTERGMPVNSLSASTLFTDGEVNPSFDITSDRTRHVDVADLWEEHQQIISRARKAQKAMVASRKPKSE